LAERGLEIHRHPPAPRLIQHLVDKVARQAGRDPRDFPHALVTEYPPGAPIGWHRDAPPFAAIFGVSLGSDCTFCLRPQLAAERVMPGMRRQDVIKLTVERRSLYVMAGPSRSNWQHSIPAVKELRYSITLRTLR
jgi:alkylated DNA repair dioxygenase AlkB